MKRADKEFEQGSLSAFCFFKDLRARFRKDAYWRPGPICKNNLYTAFVSQKPLRGAAFHPLLSLLHY